MDEDGKVSKCISAPFRLHVYPTDTVAQVKHEISAYLRDKITIAYNAAAETDSGRDTKYLLDLDRVKSERFILTHDGSSIPLVECRPLKYYYVAGYQRFFLGKCDVAMNLNSHKVEKIDGKCVAKEFSNQTGYKEDRCTGVDQYVNDQEFRVYVHTCLAGSLKDVKVRPSTKVGKLKEMVCHLLKKEKNIEIIPEEFYLKGPGGVMIENRTMQGMKIIRFTDFLLVRLDSVIL